ncbi:hypothetical protein ACVWW5_008093 [Bradyrhizobium sp. LM3.4]
MNGLILAIRSRTADTSVFTLRFWKPCGHRRQPGPRKLVASRHLCATTTKNGRTNRLASTHLPASIRLRLVRCQGGFPSRIIQPKPRYARSAPTARSKWHGELIHICSALDGEKVAVEETEDGCWQVRSFDVPIGIIDQKTRKLRRCASAAPQPTKSSTSVTHPSGLFCYPSIRWTISAPRDMRRPAPSTRPATQVMPSDRPDIPHSPAISTLSHRRPANGG